ncbi:hypothetical protein D3C81_1563030 [compost metagenome]
MFFDELTNPIDALAGEQWTRANFNFTCFWNCVVVVLHTHLSGIQLNLVRHVLIVACTADQDLVFLQVAEQTDWAGPENLRNIPNAL